TDGYPFRSVHPYLQQIFDAFGPNRMFWGTDITRMPCSWRECVTMFSEELPWLAGRDKDLVMGDALCEWLGWAKCEHRSQPLTLFASFRFAQRLYRRSFN